ncbi:MAG TPA: penicillin-binding protein activator [Burkholderiaceae bacterium]|nr:penicillin-binding protein activator [Burkholderiaceae bacterium]
MSLRSLLPLAASVAWGALAQTPPVTAPDAAREAEAARPTIMLLLPALSTAFARPAEAVRDGFLAAQKAGGEDVVLQVVETDDSPEQLAAALGAARERKVGVIVGPLTRAAVTDVVEGRRTDLPLVALNFPESDAAAPPNMLALAISLEMEAQWIARLAVSEFVGRRTADTRARIAVIAGTGGLERRIASAYMAALRREGEVPRLIEWSPASAAGVGRQLATPGLEAAFLALTARDAAQMRALIPREAQIFGTSLLNGGDPRTSPDAATLAHDLDGARFVDMPWLLEPDHPGVMVYPRYAGAQSLEMVRLYALGIDAYRVALAWMKGERRFDIDGVIGRLRIDRGNSLRVDRTPVLAVYRGGELRRIDIGR